MIYDPLLAAEAPSVSADPLADSLLTENAGDQVNVADVRDQVVLGDGDEITVLDEVTQVIVAEDASDITIQEDSTYLVVSEDQVTVISAGEIGPPGPQGLQGIPGLPGNPYTAVAPVEVDLQGVTIRLAPGTTNGQGLVWNGTAWANQVVVPAGAAGTVPYKSGSGFTGDDLNFRYDPSQQALRVTKIDTALLDGGNF